MARTVGPFEGSSVSALAAQIREGATTPSVLTERALTAAHGHGARLNCFVTIDDEGARQAARIAKKELAAGLDRGPLHGIPVGIKDNIATSGLRTTMGSRHFADFVPMADARVVTSLRRCGAVIVGKTQLHEFAYGATSDRAASGAARNPHDLALMTGGSSGGSAAAVSAGIVPLALGTDTGGSVRIPAALCGTVGLRPSPDALNPEGVFPVAPTMDTVGALTASVSDAAIAWWALSSRPVINTLEWPAWNGETVAGAAGFAASAKSAAPGRPRVGRVSCRLIERASARLQAAAKSAGDALTRGGADVCELPMPELDECAEPYRIIQSAEAAAIHKARLERAPELFEPEVLESLQDASSVRGWEYLQALETRRGLQRQVLRRISGVDVLLMPTVPIAAPAIGLRTLPSELGWSNSQQALLSMTSPWSLLGFPAMSIPVGGNSGENGGGNDNLPQSVQLIAKPGREWQLLRVALALEAGLKTR